MIISVRGPGGSEQILKYFEMGRIYSVSQINSYIKGLMRDDALLSSLELKGELSNVKYNSSGIIYFTLKDKNASISGVMFATEAATLKFRLKEGMGVVVKGSIGVYEKAGSYQIYARSISREGSGLLYEEFLALKEKLEEMGMFDSGYKRQIPSYVKRLGVVTASTGAAVRDIINISKRRNPFIEIFVYPAKVQGEGASESIVTGIKTLDSLGVDVIIVGRGGGSIEDLWAFNEEVTARAIFDCSTPVISAVGHETDTTIADFVADLRAPTPSAAAELAVFEYSDFEDALADYVFSLRDAVTEKIRNDRQRLENYSLRLEKLNPINDTRQKRIRLDALEESLRSATSLLIQKNKSRCMIMNERLAAYAPQNRLKNGFAYVEDENGKPVSDISTLNPRDVLKLIMKDGKVYTDVRKIEKNR